MTQNNEKLTPAAFGKVAVLLGGRSSEREVSLMSGQGVLNALRWFGMTPVKSMRSVSAVWLKSEV